MEKIKNPLKTIYGISCKARPVWASREESELISKAEEVIKDTLEIWQDPVTIEAAEKARDKLAVYPQFKCVICTMMEFAITTRSVERIILKGARKGEKVL